MADPSTTAETLARPPQNQPDPLVGRVINDRFKVLSVLARGGMGKVYRAEQSPLGRIVALKVLNPNYHGDNDPEFHKRFFLEASTAARLRHPNTVTIYDYGQSTDGVYFMAMELLEGRTLHRLIREASPLDPARAVHILLQTCRSLREAHGHGVIHRDLKPANIFLIHHDDDTDFVKVLDFGLVKSVDEANPGENLTQTGLFMGSPKYMAPEQIRGEKVSAATDVYALGVMLYEMLVGKVPFDRPNSVNVLMAHVSEPVPAMGSMNPDAAVPLALEEVVYRCLAKRPEDRFASMDAFIAVLKQVSAAMGHGVLPVTGTGEFLASLAPAPVPSDDLHGGSVREPTPSASRVNAIPPLGSQPPGAVSSRGLPPTRPSFQPPPLPAGTASEALAPVPTDPFADASPTTVNPGTVNPAAEPTGSRKGLAVGAGVAGLLVVGVLALGFRHSARSVRGVPPPAGHTAISPTVETTHTGLPTEPTALQVTVALDTVPADAEVLEQGTVIGHTPLHETWTGTRGDPATAHTLTLRHAGYQDLTLTLQGAMLSRTVAMQPLTQAVTPQAVTPHPGPHPTAPPPGVRRPRGQTPGNVPAGYRRDPYGDEQ